MKIKIFNLHKNFKSVLQDYFKCIYYETNGKFTDIVKISSKLLYARIKYNIGPRTFSLYRLYCKPRHQWNNYITDNQFYITAIKSKLPCHPITRLVDNKLKFYEHCIKNGLPTIPIVCTVGKIPDPLISLGIANMDNPEKWDQIIGPERQEVFIKPIDGKGGQGAFLVRRHGEFFCLNHEISRHTAKNFYRYIDEKLESETGLLIQPRMLSHPMILNFSASSGLATVRVITARVENKAKAVFAYAKIVTGQNTVDQFNSGTLGNIICAVDITTGALSEGWVARNTKWPSMKKIEVHPETGERFEDYSFPLWSKVIELSLRAQSSLPELRSIGWDIAVSDDGAMLVEANCRYSVDSLQISHCRGYKDELLGLFR